MFLDAQLLLSDAQAITVDAASTNYVDVGAVRDLFRGEPMAVVLQIDVAADGTTTDETYVFRVDSDDNTSFSSAATVSSTTITYANLTAGSMHIIVLPPSVAGERYLRLFYDVGGTTPTVTVTAFIQPLSMVQSYKASADGITIS
jgi:hypothetical protein